MRRDASRQLAFALWLGAAVLSLALVSLSCIVDTVTAAPPSPTVGDSCVLCPLVNTVILTGTTAGGGTALVDVDPESVNLTGSPSIVVLKAPSRSAAYVGQTITYVYWVINTGDVSLSAVGAYDNMLGTVILSQTAGPVVLPLINLGVGESAIGTLTYTVDAGDLPGPLVNTVVVTGTPAGDGTVTASRTVAVLVSSQPVSYRQIYLPLVLKEEPLTYLFVTSDNTGGISRLEIWRVSDNILVQYCENIPDNTVRHPCGAFPPRTFSVVAYTARCGTLETQKTWGAGEATIRVYCD